MTQPLVIVDTLIDAEPATVWDMLTQAKSPMFMGADVESDWREGSPIRMSGEFHGKAFHDHGEIRAADPGRHLAFTHISGSQPGSGNLVDIKLAPDGERTKVTLSQTPQGDQRPDEKTVAEFRKNWQAMLKGLKAAAEERASANA
jgi:uncharacterized protein YndB with AHSA1/START domain